jgi:hypothetical protein
VIVAVLVLFLLAVVLVGTTVLAAGGVLKLNQFAGIRVHYYVVSQEAWEAGHLGALLPVTVGAVIAIAAGVVVLLVPSTGAILVAGYVLLLALAAWGIVRGDRAALDAVAAAAETDDRQAE